MKLYRYQGCSHLNKIIKEALIQVRLASAYTCHLLDVSIRKSNHLFEVALMMERLEGDLEADIRHRILQNIPYSEDEWRYILKCMAEALLYAKLKVNSI